MEFDPWGVPVLVVLVVIPVSDLQVGSGLLHRLSLPSLSKKEGTATRETAPSKDQVYASLGEDDTRPVSISLFDSQTSIVDSVL
jgi:hypothetical protein